MSARFEHGVRDVLTVDVISLPDLLQQPYRVKMPRPRLPYNAPAGSPNPDTTSGSQEEQPHDPHLMFISRNMTIPLSLEVVHLTRL